MELIFDPITRRLRFSHIRLIRWNNRVRQESHHLINESSAVAVYLEVGLRNARDLTTCSDIDRMSSNADGRFVHKNGTSLLQVIAAQFPSFTRHSIAWPRALASLRS